MLPLYSELTRSSDPDTPVAETWWSVELRRLLVEEDQSYEKLSGPIPVSHLIDFITLAANTPDIRRLIDRLRSQQDWEPYSDDGSKLDSFARYYAIKSRMKYRSTQYLSIGWRYVEKIMDGSIDLSDRESLEIELLKNHKKGVRPD
jgi:hypothetical protein